MNNFDSKTAKIMIALIAVFAMIVICLPYAYRNAKNTAESEIKRTNEYSVPVDNGSLDPNRIKSQLDNESNTEPEFKETKREKIPGIKLEEIKENEIIQEIDNNNFAKAEALRTEKKYESAVYEYEQMAKLSNDNKIKAKWYEEIAITYAVMKRYGTALPYAEKAYNTEPNIQRQFLLARILYKTGHEDIATEKIDEILKGDFEE